jgi:hypothetical protein
LGHLKRALYARMEEVSFRSGAAVAGGVLTAAGVAITLAVVLGGHGDVAASASSSRVAVPSLAPPSPAPVSSSSSSSPSPTPRPSRTKDAAAAAGAYRPPSATRASATRHAAAPVPGSTPTPRLRIRVPRRLRGCRPAGGATGRRRGPSACYGITQVVPQRPKRFLWL